MAIFPSCELSVLLSQGRAISGQRLEGTIVLDVPEPIPRAERLEMAFRSAAIAGYGSGKSRSVKTAVLFHAPLSLALPGNLGAGQHRHPFHVDVPAWLPPAYKGKDCSIEHSILVRVDVDWARDPKATFGPKVALPARRVESRPVVVRSHPSFHETVIVDVMLSSAAVVEGGVIEGSVALRSGHDARFDAVELSLSGYATIVMGRGDIRADLSSRMRFEREKLRDGRALAFRYPIDPAFVPTFRTGFIDHNLSLEVSLDIPWGTDPSFLIPIELLPAGSTLDTGAPAIVLGNERLRRMAAVAAQQTGLRAGELPVLVEGEVGGVSVRVSDHPSDSTMAFDVDFGFRDLGLGIELRPKGLLDFGTSPLLPPSLKERYVLRREADDCPPVADVAIERFLHAIAGDIGVADSVRLSDHHFGLHFVTGDDSQQKLVELARFARGRAEAMAAAINHPERGLPFPQSLAHTRASWEALAFEHGAALVPTQPAVHGITVASRILGGEDRRLTASLRAVWTEGKPRGVRWDIDLSAMALPKKAHEALERWQSETEGSTDREKALLAMFTTIEAPSRESVVLEATSGWHDDPRAWLPGLEAFYAWVLEARGERRSESPYR